MKTSRLVFFLITLIITACNVEKKAQVETRPRRQVTVSEFGKMEDGRVVRQYTLTNANNVEMKVINYGGIIVSLKTPDANGQLADIVLGYDSLEGYIRNNPYFGALIGRYGNRIAGGKFTLEGKAYSLPQNNGPNHLHGGPKGFDKVFWEIEVGPDSSSLLLSYRSADGEQGYPGNLSVNVVYRLTDANELRIEYDATTDAPTIVNLTQHSYFNLGNQETILGHQLQIDADSYLPVDATLIPTGKLQKVEGTPFDFRKPKTIGADIDANDEQIKLGKGFDHCWVLNGGQGKLRKVAVLSDSVSGRQVEVHTTEPGIQFYSGNFLDGTIKGKGGTVYNFRSGLCLETQHYPDSPNRPEFPTVVLKPGEKYHTETVYTFGVVTKQ